MDIAEDPRELLTISKNYSWGLALCLFVLHNGLCAPLHNWPLLQKILVAPLIKGKGDCQRGGNIGHFGPATGKYRPLYRFVIGCFKLWQGHLVSTTTCFISTQKCRYRKEHICHRLLQWNLLPVMHDLKYFLELNVFYVDVYYHFKSFKYAVGIIKVRESGSVLFLIIFPLRNLWRVCIFIV